MLPWYLPPDSMLSRADILAAFDDLNGRLETRGVRGEVCLYGGAVMCVVYDARPSTRDVDAVFAPTGEIREAAAEVARARGLPLDWLNDGVKGFVVEHARNVAIDLSHLRVLVPEPDYLLAMKAMAARVDTADRDDVKFLIQRLCLRSPDDVFAILARYYPAERIKPATRFFIEEIFER